jgi:DNA topoisomerase-1
MTSSSPTGDALPDGSVVAAVPRRPFEDDDDDDVRPIGDPDDDDDDGQDDDEDEDDDDEEPMQLRSRRLPASGGIAPRT